MVIVIVFSKSRSDSNSSGEASVLESGDCKAPPRRAWYLVGVNRDGSLRRYGGGRAAPPPVPATTRAN